MSGVCVMVIATNDAPFYAAHPFWAQKSLAIAVLTDGQWLLGIFLRFSAVRLP